MKIDAFIPVHLPISVKWAKPEAAKQLESRLDKIGDEIANASGDLQFKFVSNEVLSSVKVTIKKLPPKGAQFHRLYAEANMRNWIVWVLKFTVDIKYVEGELSAQLAKSRQIKVSSETEYNWVLESALSMLFDNLARVELCAHISSFGAFMTTGYQCYVKNKFMDDFSRSPVTEFGESWLRARDMRWPLFEDLSFVETWDFLSNLKAFNWELTDSEVSRAISIFSHQMINNDSPSLSLMNAVSGVEALLSEGMSGSVFQIKSKCRALFGEHVELQNAIKKMYKVRSEIAHGKWDLQNAFDSLDGDDAKIQQSLLTPYDSEKFATSLLAAVIQRAVKKKVLKLKFETKWMD